MNHLLLYSGGLDSTTLLYDYQDAIKMCVYLDYGNANRQKELEAVTLHCQILNKPLEVLDIRDVFKTIIGTNSHSLLSNSSNKGTYVFPFRNGVFASIVMAYAEFHNFSAIYAGFCCSDNFDEKSLHNTTDTTYTFCEGLNLANTNVKIFAPYCQITKSRVIKKAKILNLDLKNTWSCYVSANQPCGKCTACLTLKESLYYLQTHGE